MLNLDEIIVAALSEDIGDGDHTTQATIPPEATGKVKLLVKEAGVFAGMNIAPAVYKKVNDQIEFIPLLDDGSAIKPGDIAFYAAGPSAALLTAERLVLNFLQRMSGIATQTRKYADAVQGTKAVVLDTRKTTPNMRLLEKEAVRIGGGGNHRFGLFDMILIKDNHVDFAGGIDQAIDAAHLYLERKNLSLNIEIETRNLSELSMVLKKGGVNRIMLDNFNIPDLKEAVKMVDGRFETEASGGITLQSIREYAECGVDFISVGALTHHIRSLDLSLKAVNG